MSENATDIGIRRSVIAVAQADNKLKGVELQEENGAVELLWTKSSQGADTDWQHFAVEAGSSVEPAPQADTASDRMVAVGFNSAGMAFYRVSVPAVGKQELAAIVKLQAETLLPLPFEQMELAWRAGRARDGQIGVTMAAARTERLQRFVEAVRSLEPTRILLDCEGIVKAWRTFFSGSEDVAVVVSAGAQDTQVCLAEKGRLSNALVLDMGIEDFAGDATEGQTEATERFTQDMRSVLELFGYARSQEIPIFVLSDGSADYVNIVSSLRLAGLNARVALPEVGKVKAQSEHGVERIYEYRVPIGLGLMALEAREDELNIFERLYNPAGKELKKHWLYSPKVAGVITALALVLLVVVCYAVDLASPGAIEKRLTASGSEADIDLLMQRQKLIKTVALRRPDLLDLLSEVSTSGERGIKLESFHFKMGQRVNITGQAPSNEQLYRFQESLQQKKDIKDVKMTATQSTQSTRSAPSPGAPRGASTAGGSRSPGSRVVKFTITFHYRNFTK